MHRNQIITILREHGFDNGRLIAHSKTGYCKRYPKHFVVFNAQILWRRGRILKQVDLDLTLDADKLTAAARTAGENFYVLYENRPHIGWERKLTAMIPVLRDAVWWTRIRREDQDVFLPVETALGRSKLVQLACSTGWWQGQPAYAVDVWLNPKWHNMHTSGAVIELCGHPPRHLPTLKRAKGREEFVHQPSSTRGRAVRPVFRQKSGLLQFVWFSHGATVPAVLYDNSVGLLHDLTFSCHAGCQAIHVRRDGKVIGLIWPSRINAPDVITNAHKQLKSRVRFQKQS
jgi:hypothetical protein